MHRPDRTRAGIRAEIASAAARLMAEDGITDFRLAKKKALRQMGLPEHTALPDNAEVEAELRAWRSLYQGEEHEALLAELRQTAVDLLEFLERFHPYLTGSVLEGTAGEHSRIDILLFPDSAKEVEIFLLNHDLTFSHGEPRGEKVEAVLILETDTADANLIVLPPQLERVALKYRDGRPRERARVEAVRALLAAGDPAPSCGENP